MIYLGDKVRDKVSGFEGIAVTRHTYLNGCNRISVQPAIDKDGKLPEYEAFDEPQLEVIESMAVEGDDGHTGGPDKYPDKRR